jgi:hypothetical protein
MLRSVQELQGYRIHATDGEIGEVYDFYFDDQTWTIRYLVVETGGFLSGQRVLLSTVPLGQPKWDEQTFPVLLTRQQIEESPAVNTEQPVSRQMESELYSYYGWSPYWRLSTPALAGGAMAVVQAIETMDEAPEEEQEPGDYHLRSVREVEGYQIQALDGEVGHVSAFIADDVTWELRYLVVDTGGWLSGREVLVAPAWIQQINWVTRKVYVDLHQEVIERSPEFDPKAPVNREYEVRLYDYYGRPKYWTRT